jgi:hypothetical protein
MKRIILFLSFILLVISGEVLGQTLTGSTYVFGHSDASSNTIGSLELGAGNGFGSTPFSSGDGIQGPVMGASVTTGPPYQLYRNGSSFSSLSIFDIYPTDKEGRRDAQIPFFGDFINYGSFRMKYVYEMLAPRTLTLSPAPGQVCGNSYITLNSVNNWPLFSNSVVTTSVVWEYNVNDAVLWKGLDSSSNSFYFSFIASQYIPEIKIATQNIKFRCRIKAKYSNAVYYSPYSAITGILAISPSPPTIPGGIDKIIVTPACNGMANGKIVVPGNDIQSGFADMRWIIRPGNFIDPCDPGIIPGASKCGDMVEWSNGSHPVAEGVSAKNIGVGNYTLWLLNPGEGAGNCITSIPVTMTQLDPLTLNGTPVHISCYGAANGSVSVTAAGGNGAKTGYLFKLIKSGVVISQEQRIVGTNMQWQNLTPGDYVAEVRDSTCSDIRSYAVTLKQPDLLTGTLTVGQPLCIIPGNGSIGVVATGATRYKYKLYKNAALIDSSGTVSTATYSFSGLASGNYSVEILNADYLGCTGITKTATLNAIAALSLQLTASDSVSCNGGSDGRLQFSASGGSGSFTYTIGATSNTTGLFTGLAAGDYSVTLKNQGATCNDAVTKTFTVYQRKPIQVTLQKTDITCNTANNGIIKATVQDGSGSYLYTWQQFKAGAWAGNAFWFSTDTQIEGLEPGMYRVIISDAKAAGCTVTSGVITLVETAPVAITAISVTDAVCLAEGASVNITASGGDAIYTYKWSLDGTTFTAFTAGNALHAAGTYTFSVADGKGCTVISPQTYVVTLPDAELSFTTALSGYNGFNISCTGSSDGRIEVTALGGNHSYQYKLNSGTYQSGNVFDNLAAGSYTVSVKDGRGCIKSTTIILTQPAIMIKAVKTDILCYGASTGNITTNISGGAAPYTILLNGVAANNVTSNLPAGDYTLHITDANGCFKDSLVKIVHLYPVLKIQTATVSDIVCYGTTGSIALATTGGDGMYQYAISADDWNTSTAYTSGGALAVGNYSVQVTDGKGCMAAFADHLPITSPAAALAFTATLSDYNGYNISCSGGDNGFANVLPTGGSGVYTYAPDNGTYGDASLVEHINAGSHILRVKDSRGCISSATYTFTQSSQAINISLLNKNDVICAATPAGNITVTGSGGVGALQYSIDNTNWQSGNSFYNLTAGSYTIMVKDANSCSKGLLVQINSQDPAIVVDNVTLNDIVCYEGKGTINVQVHGGAGTLVNEYSLDGGAYTTFNNTTPLGVGTYKVRVKDAPGCYSPVVDAGTITSPAAALTAVVTTSNFNGMQVSCNGLADGTVAVATAGGGAGYQYSFNNEAYTGISSYDHLAAGTYSLKIKDNRGCVITKSVVMQQSAVVTLAVTGIENLSCGADPTGKITLQAGGGVTPYQYDLSDGKWQGTPVFPSLMSGTYNVQVKDINGCIAANNATVNALNPAITAVADITPVNCFGENNGALKVNISGGDGQYTYQWNVADPQHLKAGNYTVKVTDGKGCFQSFSYNVPQPDLLTLATIAPAVCDGLSDGSITATVQGGVSPYQYMLDQGVWGVSPVFENMAAGNYHVKVQDANGCNVSKDLVIAKANSKPDVNFLVASRKNALDTLVIKEISLPAPDNVSWTYSPEAVLLGDGMIKFSQPGNYWVQMTATFGSCTYSLKKDLQISDYDPLAGPVYTMPVHVIDTLILSPNPNNGYFSFQVKMIKKQQVVVNVYDMNGRLVDSKQYSPSLLINDTFSLSNSISGTYLLRVIAENDSRDLRFIISR